MASCTVRVAPDKKKRFKLDSEKERTKNTTAMRDWYTKRRLHLKLSWHKAVRLPHNSNHVPSINIVKEQRNI